MARLPQPGSDNGTWGDILNEYLSQALAPNGELKPDSVGADQLKDNSVTNSAIAPNTITSTELASNAVTAAIIADGSITETLLDISLQAKINQTAPVSSVNTKTGVVTLDKSDIGLESVDNTSDATKNSAIATLTNKTLVTPKINTIRDSTDNKTVLDLSFNNAGGLAVNYAYIKNALTGGYPALGAWGTDTDISLNLLSKGAGIVRANGVEVATISGGQTLTNKTLTSPKINTILDTNGNASAAFGATASAVNYTVIRNSAAGSPISLEAAGSDNDISIKLQPKGTGWLILSAGTGLTPTLYASGPDTNHHISIRSKGLGNVILRDDNQWMLQVQGVTSASNYISIQNAVSGSAPIITANGTDTNASLDLRGRGTGTVRLTTGSLYPSSSTTSFYNTTDEATNYERVRTYWSSNIFNITGENGGTGGIRGIRIGSNFNGTSLLINPVGPTRFLFGHNSTSDPAAIGLAFTGGQAIQSSGSYTNVVMNPTINQTGSASYTALLINPTETATGSGTKLLADMQVGGTSRLTIDNSGSLSQASTATNGFVQYNTTDQTTNYERVKHYWTGNIYTIGSENGGTGTARAISIIGGGNRTLTLAGASGSHFDLNSSTSIAGVNIVRISGSWLHSSGISTAFTVTPTLSQTGTAGYTMLLVNPTETATGSGTKLLADFQVGGVSKTRIDNTGSHYISSGATNPLTIYNTTDETTNYERFRAYWSGNTMILGNELGGTGFMRNLDLRAAGIFRMGTSGAAANGGVYQFMSGSSQADSLGIGVTGTYSSSSTAKIVAIQPTLNQSGTAGYTALLINPTETATGSGAKNLINAQVGGTDKFTVDNTGTTSLANTAAISLYNTSDQTTNYERVRQYWSGSTAYITTESGGTGSARSIYLGVGGAIRGLLIGGSPNASGRFQFNENTTLVNGVGVQFSNSFSSTSGINIGVYLSGTISQSGTAGYTMLKVNPIESTVGSGTKLLADFQVGSISKVSIDNTGVITAAAAGTAAGSVVTVDGTQTLTNKTFSTISFSGATTLPQGASLQLFNTSDQTTNYERVRHYWTSNIYTIATDAGGTGALRVMEIKANTVTFRMRPAGSTSGLWEFASGLGSVGTVGMNITGSYNATSGVNAVSAIQPTITQTGTAGYTALLINPTESTTGTGTKTLIDAQVGGTSKFKVDNTGKVTYNNGPTFSTGTGSPEGVVDAPVGSLYTRADGGPGTTLYVKESGIGNTGWAAK